MTGNVGAKPGAGFRAVVGVCCLPPGRSRSLPECLLRYSNPMLDNHFCEKSPRAVARSFLRNVDKMDDAADRLSHAPITLLASAAQRQSEHRLEHLGARASLMRIFGTELSRARDS